MRAHRWPSAFFGEHLLHERTKPEHMLHDAFGGRKTTSRVICAHCSNTFGSGIDKALTGQFEVIRNLFQMKSGSGSTAPMLRKVKAGSQTISARLFGRPASIDH